MLELGRLKAAIPPTLRASAKQMPQEVPPHSEMPVREEDDVTAWIFSKEIVGNVSVKQDGIMTRQFIMNEKKKQETHEAVL